MDLELGFHEEMLCIYDEAATFGYRPTYFCGWLTTRAVYKLPKCCSLRTPHHTVSSGYGKKDDLTSR